MTTVRADVRRLRAFDESALDATSVLRLPCFIVEARHGVLTVHGDPEWSAPEQPSGVGNAGWQWDGERLRAHTGRYGFRPLFVRRLADGVAISPSLVRLMAIGGLLPIDDGAMAVFLRIGFFVGEDTPFRDVRVLPPGGRLEWRDGVLSVEATYPRVRASTLTRAAAIDAYIEVFRDAVRRCGPGDQPNVVPLSGGRDSRHILFELCASGFPPERCLTLRNYPPRGSRDVVVATEIARAVGVTHELIEEIPSRASAELRKNLITHFCADEHAWFMALADRLSGQNVAVWDGIAGDVLSNGHRLEAPHLALARAGNIEELTQSLLDEGAMRIVPPAMAARWSREAAVARLTEELRHHLDAPNPIGSFFFWNRTRREIALVPFGLWNVAGSVRTPYLDPAVFDLLVSLPAEMFLDKRFHPNAIRRAYPEHAYLRFDTETGLRPVRAPNGTPEDAPYYRRLLRDSAAYVGGARRSRMVRRRYVASRAAYWYVRSDFSDTALMPVAIYLAQLDTVAQWAAGRDPELGTAADHS
ncbi:MAG TPA: asparagine synthetase B family protein [Gemmatimonadaceae bacterium]|nr:asparagine synthetase B family protein [Gemmatimonadaceae bacterium]